eukprot:NODE_6377_length_514_cov_33.393548_g5602_i0.p1 GENE.NODE_6377_length_514_cov_33.393548_g5602_i0~~NODE_6377_length_514_cov_33.393548_g5602_i0.p1  ORF type:complete len:153 (+),score=40.44 NODE_6377_length_514_cov_33.393548_g5602_i0:54-512(+)
MQPASNRFDALSPNGHYHQMDKKSIWVGRIPKSVTEGEIHSWFEDFGHVNCVKLNIRELHNFAYVNMSSEYGALCAVQFKQHKLGGSEVDVRLKSYYRPMKPNVGAVEAKLFCGKIPKDVTEGTIRKHFERHGDVTNVQLKKKKKKKKKTLR